MKILCVDQGLGGMRRAHSGKGNDGGHGRAEVQDVRVARALQEKEVCSKTHIPWY
jgi:hypothetical protein